MKGLVICNKGIEDACSLEIEEIIDGSCVSKEGYVLFDFDSGLDRLAYLSQSISKVILVLDSFKSEEVISVAEKLDLTKWFTSDRSFKVEGKIINNDLNLEKLKGQIGAAIKGKSSVDLENPSIVIYIYINGNNGYIGIDFSGKDLSKRSYRIFVGAKSIKSTIAYSIVRLANVGKKDCIVDPFCLSGIIPIEASLFLSGLSVNFFEKDDFLFNRFSEFDFDSVDNLISKEKLKIYGFDNQFKHIDSAKKNAKIANVHKLINFSRLDISWLDTKFDRESVDKIITCLPNISKHSNEKQLLKLYKEFFYQADFVLSKKGMIVICTRNPLKVKENMDKFKVELEKEVWQGKDKYTLLKIVR